MEIFRHLPQWKAIKTQSDLLIRKTIRANIASITIYVILYALHHAIKTTTHRQPEGLSTSCHHPDTGRKKGGRHAAWCNPSEGHHTSRLNNVFPMPCQTFSSLWGARQPLQPHSMKHLSLCMVGNSLFDPDIAPQTPQRWHSYTRLYVSWMFTRSLYLVSSKTCVYEGGWLIVPLWFPLVYMNQLCRLQIQTKIKLHIRFHSHQIPVWNSANRKDVKW